MPHPKYRIRGILLRNNTNRDLRASSVSAWEADDGVRFYNIYLRREFLDGALLVKAGQLAADDDFFLSSFADTLLNGAFGDFSSAREQQLAPFYPLAGPGVYLLAASAWESRPRG